MPRSASIRDLLLRLVLAVALPLVALAAWNLYLTHERESQQARQQVLHLAQMTASETGRFLDRARSLLNGLAARPEVRSLDGARCDPILKEFHALIPRFANVATMDNEARIICSAVPLSGPARGNPDNFLKLLRAPDRLTVGKAAPGVITGRWVVPVGRPLLDAQGAVAGAVVLPVDLLTFPVLPSLEGLPANAIVGLIDADGTVLTRSHDAQRFVGTKAGAGRAAQREKSGTAEVTGIDGIARIQGFAPVPGTDWIAVASVPASVVYAGIQAQIAVTTLVGLAVLIVALLLAVYFSRRIHDAIAALASAAGEVAAGNLAVRAPVAGAAEIVELGTQFNRMLDALVHAEQESRKSHERFEKIFHGAPLAAAVSTIEDGRLVEINASYCALIGRPREELIGRTVVELGIWDQPQRDALIARLSAEGRVSGFEAQVRTAAGETRNLLTSFERIDFFDEPCMLLIGADITGRKQAEEKNRAQLDELLRWRALMIGREERMRQLKAEVNELLERQGQPARYPAAAATAGDGK